MKIKQSEVNIYKALAHPLRLELAKKLMEKSACVCELNEDIDFTQPLISQHLKIMREAGVVNQEKDGLRVNYSLTCNCIKDLIEAVENLVLSREVQTVNDYTNTWTGGIKNG